MLQPRFGVPKGYKLTASELLTQTLSLAILRCHDQLSAANIHQKIQLEYKVGYTVTEQSVRNNLRELEERRFVVGVQQAEERGRPVMYQITDVHGVHQYLDISAGSLRQILSIIDQGAQS